MHKSSKNTQRNKDKKNEAQLTGMQRHFRVSVSHANELQRLRIDAMLNHEFLSNKRVNLHYESYLSERQIKQEFTLLQ